jgi:dTMP kinase
MSKIIAIEGIDGAGKATQTSMLAESLQARGLGCETYAFPSYNENVAGQLLAELTAGKRGDFANADPRLASLPYSVDRFESSGKIREALAAGKIVICDRFSGSNQIHQGGKLKIEEERIAYLEWLDLIEHVKLGNPRPDLVIYLKAPVEVSLKLLAQKRAAKSTEVGDGEMDQVEKDRAYLDNSHAMANWLAAYYSHWRVIDCVDADGNIRTREAIHTDVMTAVDSYLK